MRRYRSALLVLALTALTALTGGALAQGLGMGFGIDDGRARGTGAGSAVQTCQGGAAKFNGACNSGLAGMMG